MSYINTCCFFGHRTINETEELKTKLCEAVEDLITNQNVDTFLFGSKIALDFATKLNKEIIVLP